MKTRFALIGVSLLAAGCTTIPSGPSTLALPGSTKAFDEFRYDDGACRQYAFDSIGGQTAARAQEDAGIKSTIAGAAIGAMLGGAISGGHGAAVGAGVGGAAGGLAGVSAADASGYEAQRRYDHAYTQCMYGKGHRVAVSGRFAPSQAHYPPPPPRTVYRLPPPPPGYHAPPPSPSAYPPVPPRGSAPGW